MSERLPLPGPLPALRPGDTLRLKKDTPVGRIYFAGGAHPSTWDGFRRFGPVSSMRFDHHSPPPREHSKRAISYVAPSRGRKGSAYDPLVTCICECFAATGTIDLRLGEPWFVLWTPARRLSLLDVVDGPWITRAHGNGAISTGPRGTSRIWARAIYRTYPGVDGIFYQSSTLPMMRSVALFDRAQDAVPSRYQVALPLTHPGLRAPIRRIACSLGLALLP